MHTRVCSVPALEGSVVMPGGRWHEASLQRDASLLLVGALLVVVSACTSARVVQDEPTVTTFDQCYEQGLAALERGDRDQAKTLFELAIQRNPAQPYPHFYLGVLYDEAGEDELALVAFEQALEIEPSLFEAYHNIGTIMLRRRRLGEAVDALERAVELNPDHVPSFNNLGKAYYLAGLPELAGAAYEEALARDPVNEVALENLAKLARAAGSTEMEQQYLSRLQGAR